MNEQQIVEKVNGGDTVNLKGEGVFVSLYKDTDGYVSFLKQGRQPTRYESEESFERYIYTLLKRSYEVV